VGRDQRGLDLGADEGTEAMSDDDTTYDLVLSFSGLYPTMEQEHAFFDGVEFGQIWARMSSGAEAEIETTTHETNREVIARAAAAKGWTVECKPVTAGWDSTTLRKVRAEKPNPHGLRVVG
jgi:hypothetical protein